MTDPHSGNAGLIQQSPLPRAADDRKAGLLKLATYAAFFVSFLAVLFLRRADQLRHPQVWDEEGTFFLPDFINHGWRSLFYPVKGYLILVPKLISFISFHISIFYYPGISTVLAWFGIAAVCCAITFCPTWMRARVLLGFSALLVPSNVEVFGINLYTFWWASLLLFLVVVWQNDSRDLLVRSSFLILGGLSAPIIVLIPPLLALRLILLDHKKRNAFIFAVSVLCALVQAVALHFSGEHQIRQPVVQDLLEIIPRFFGNYVLGNLWEKNLTLLWIAGSATFAIILSGIRWDRGKPLIPFLLLSCLACIGLIAVRDPLWILNPRDAGPRYFFFPDVFISWMLLNLVASNRNIFIKAAAVIILLLALVNVVPVLSRSHLNLHWSDQLASATHFPEYSIPIQYDGYSTPWYMPIQGARARALLGADPFASPRRLARAHLFPFTVRQVDPEQIPVDPTYAKTSALASSSPPVTNCTIKSPGFACFGSNIHGDVDRLAISLHLHRGDHVLYRSGADTRRQYVRIQSANIPFFVNLPVADDWTVLDFSSDQLPEEFTAVFSDQGSDAGEWFAVALKQ